MTVMGMLQEEMIRGLNINQHRGAMTTGLLIRLPLEVMISLRILRGLMTGQVIRHLQEKRKGAMTDLAILHLQEMRTRDVVMTNQAILLHLEMILLPDREAMLPQAEIILLPAHLEAVHLREEVHDLREEDNNFKNIIFKIIGMHIGLW